ncbi:hypothetical protein POKO110462_06395 [Pontibacter korlensis]|uniref:Lipoprotein n=1 Tax=Pontibacter korlensis TaxID=400092 RepID=A0A0E3UYF1_9BACT|nr:hypothetical protein [Pontibacter korlensis]AKD04416.1 hypothetical protein PKOR_16640 [Pontibacter korlensis]
MKKIVSPKIKTQLLGLLLLSACSTPDSMKGFDSKTWKDDRDACQNQRAALVDDFEQIRKELYGKKEYVVRNVLGKPDSEELMERSQRIYFYYIEPGTQCDSRNELSEANRVQVRINSLGKVSEITYYKPVETQKPE